MNTNFDSAINDLLENIIENYKQFATPGYKLDSSGFLSDQVKDFIDNLKVVPGKKYTKITSRGSAWGFIVAVDNDKKFRKGDILKPAGWATPARNHARGNILDGGYAISWTGPAYLRG